MRHLPAAFLKRSGLTWRQGPDADHVPPTAAQACRRAPRSGRHARKRIRHLAGAQLGRPGRPGRAAGLRPAPGRPAARRAHGGDRRQPPAPVRHHAGGAVAGRGARCRCTRTRSAPNACSRINNAEVRFALVEDQEQVDKLLEIRDQLPAALATSTYDDPRGLRNYDEPGLASLDALIAAGKAFAAQQPAVVSSRSRQGPARRRGGDVLHLGHHRQPQGRGAHPQHAAGPRHGRRRVRQADRTPKKCWPTCRRPGSARTSSATPSGWPAAMW